METLKYLSKREKIALIEYLKRLEKQYGEQVVRVVLFGSKTRGDFDGESDLDLLVVIRSGDKHFREELERVGFEIDLEYDVILSDMIVDLKRYELMQKIKEPLYQSIEKEGIDLWTKIPELSSK